MLWDGKLEPKAASEITIVFKDPERFTIHLYGEEADKAWENLRHAVNAIGYESVCKSEPVEMLTTA